MSILKTDQEFTITGDYPGYTDGSGDVYDLKEGDVLSRWSVCGGFLLSRNGQHVSAIDKSGSGIGGPLLILKEGELERLTYRPPELKKTRFERLAEEFNEI